MQAEQIAFGFERYGALHVGERELAAHFVDFLASAPQVFERSHGVGHFTGSAWVVSADGARVLLTHHAKLNLWLQPGGHADGDRDLARVALREAREETGVAGLQLEDGVIFDLDRHAIPARKAEPEHWHYDVRYVVRAGADERFVVSAESHALAWREIAAVAAGSGRRRLGAPHGAQMAAAPQLRPAPRPPPGGLRRCGRGGYRGYRTGPAPRRAR
jgi:8-oxo-dGTP pyrophosphatase MutT (NUDIX family)